MTKFIKKLSHKSLAVITAGFMALGAVIPASANNTGMFSETAELAYMATVARPDYLIKGSTGERQVKLSTSTSGATIYYTTDGKTPTTSSKTYNGKPLKTTKDIKIKAIAVKGSQKSNVMVQTVSVKTQYGDVTGDGKINKNDYIRLKTYLSNKATYICKDNADCDGNGEVSSKDLTALSQYLNGILDNLPNTPLITVNTPTAAKESIYGGVQVTLNTTTSGATIYYTTNGAKPTTNSTKYSSPFTLTSSKTVKAIACKDGETSEMLTFSVDVGTTSTIQEKSDVSDMAVEIKLSCNTSDSVIYYTTDGSDPRTSSTVKSYYGSIKIYQSTTIKAYARCKGKSDSSVCILKYTLTISSSGGSSSSSSSSSGSSSSSSGSSSSGSSSSSSGGSSSGSSSSSSGSSSSGSSSSSSGSSSSGSSSSSSGSSTRKTCPSCGGTGECSKCGGKRYFICTHCGMGNCSYCAGTGKTYDMLNHKFKTCSVCRGSGNCKYCKGNYKQTCTRCGGKGYCMMCYGLGRI
ncbi:MAG: chitobiase/beta-hexosaminidase C-terminal domain-containing protein [Ruminiclostridium sp.]|nr:chitobiase/beta-hexosaminidase C-terminal domain-containing protein [Ruminiclostridium sp.]